MDTIASTARSLAAQPHPIQAESLLLEQIEVVSRFSTMMMAGAVFMGALIVWQLWSGVDHSWVTSWYLLLVGSTAIRDLMQRRFLRRARPQDARRWQKIILVGSAIAGLIWSIPGSVLLASGPTSQFVIGVCLVSSSAAGVASLSALRYAYGAFLLPFMIPVAISNWWQGDEHIVVAVGVMMYTIAMLAVGERYRINMEKMIRLRFENEALTLRLRGEKEIIEQVNRSLQRQVSDRERAEALLRTAKSEAEAANRAKSQFLANMSHEVRTPLNIIIGNAELLQRTQLNPKQHKFSQTVRNAGEQLLRIINDILDLSRIEAGRLKLSSEPFDPRELLDEVVDLMMTQALRKGLRLTHDIHLQTPVLVEGDAERLRQVLINLISNAVKFTSQGSITIRLQPIAEPANLPFDIHPPPGARWLRWSVSDSGIGIPAEAQKILFEPFSQVDDSTTRRFGGTGLGLAICRQLIEAMQGRIGFTSEPERGSTFWFEIALDCPEPASHIETEQSLVKMPTFNARVLIAEDNESNASMLADLLQLMGCRTRIVSSGRDALASIETESFDLALMDWHMPEIDGLEATRKLRELEATGTLPTQRGRLPVVALTASVMPGDRETCLAAGMDDYLSKPFLHDELLGILRRWLGPATSSPSA